MPSDAANAFWRPLEYEETHPRKISRHSTPREAVAAHLLAAGIRVNPQDIRVPRGAWTHDRMDVCERWNVTGTEIVTGRSVEVTGTESLTKCRKGIRLEKNTPKTELYGDFIASPLRA
jgi:hypothetical protein